MVQKGDEMEDRLTEPGDVMLLYLPLAHNYGRLLHLSAAYTGFTVAFLPDPLQAAAELPRVRPTLFPSVPRVYEKIHTAVAGEFASQTGARRVIVDWALRVGREVSELRQSKQTIPSGLALQHRVADRLVYSKVKRRLGGRLRVANAGGAPLAREIAEFFHAIDILILEGYGLSEVTTAATVNRHNDFRFGTVGKALPGVEIRIAEDGEILLRSNTVFAGYYRDEAATAATLDAEGFVHTGDVGHLDDDGFLYLTDRKKDMIISGGENIASSEVERVIYQLAEVSEAAVVGVPDARWGERVVAAVVLRAGARLDVDQLQRHCRVHLGGFKIPRELVVRAALPRNPSGKVLKRVLRDELTRAACQG
jgi:long-chain acyl-CoA synthetase